MTFARSIRFGCALAAASTGFPAYADPITVAVFGAAFAATLGGAIVTAVITVALTTLASMVLTKLFAPKQNAQDRQASVVSLSIGENPREALFGEVGTGGTLADAFNYGGADGTDWEVQIIVVADHRCHSLTGFYVGDAYVPFGGDGAVAGYNGQLEVYWLAGTEDQVLPSIVTTYGGWAASDNLCGLATVVVAYRADAPSAKNPVWPGGRPSFLWVVKGALLYLPRLDTSVGGSGAHRWDDPTTREWSDNLIDCRYNWLRGIYACDRINQQEMLLVGRGLSVIEAPPERTFAAANTCDEMVPLKAGGSEKRYRCNVVVRANEDFISTEETFAAACGGIIIQREGGVEVEPGSARSVVAEITDADIVTGAQITFNAFKSDAQRVNSVAPRYVEPAQRWVDHAAPLRRRLADLAIDGGPREETLTLIAVTSGTQAQRCGEIRRRLARLERSASFPLGPRFSHLEDGDWIAWTSARHLKGARVVFRIESYNVAANWQNTLSISEISSTCFGWDAFNDEIMPGAVAEQQMQPAPGAPTASNWSVSGTTLTAAGGSVPAIVIIGAAGNTYVGHIIFEYRPVDLVLDESGAPVIDGAGHYTVAGTPSDDDWIGTELAAPTVTRREISSVKPGAAYQAGVTYVIGDVPTDRLVLGPVIAGALTISRGVHTLATQSVAFPITSDDDSITVAAFTGVLDDGRTIHFAVGSASGLSNSTPYVVLWNITAAAYATPPSPAISEMASSDYVFLGVATTSAAGVYPEPAPSPPGYGGGGGYCVGDDTLILMANDSRDGPGEEKPASDVMIGDWVWSLHERTMRPGAFLVIGSTFATEPVFTLDGYPKATAGHRFFDRHWTTMKQLGGVPDGEATVWRATVLDAKTYLSRHPDAAQPVLSHNLKPVSEN